MRTTPAHVSKFDRFRPTARAATVVSAALLCALLGLPAAGWAQPSGGTSPDAQRYSGAFYGPEAHVGFGWSRGAGRRLGSGMLGLRHAFVFNLGDTRLSYAFDDLLEGAGPERHGIWLHTAVHPLAAVILGSDWLAYTLASPYFEIGVGGLAYVGGTSGGVDSPAVGWSLGAGLDIPLGNPDLGTSPWLSLVYRNRKDATNRKTPSVRPRADLFFLGVGWRINGTFFR